MASLDRNTELRQAAAGALEGFVAPLALVAPPALVMLPALMALVALVTLVAIPASALGRPATDLARCASGRVPVAVRSSMPAAIAAAQHRFDSTTANLRAADRRRADAAFDAGVSAYVYGMPTVLLRATVDPFPMNELIGLGRLATPSSQAVVAPNHDTLYSVARLDVTAEPIVLGAPVTAGRYSVVQLLDANTNVIGYIGSGEARRRASDTLITGPGWRGAAPLGVRVLRSPTRLVWALGRTLIDGERDTAAANALMMRYSATPLSVWTTGQRHFEVVLAQPPNRPRVTLPSGRDFFAALGQALSEDPPAPADRCAVNTFRDAGVVPGSAPSTSADPLLRRALSAASAAGAHVVDHAVTTMRMASARRNHGWTVLTGDVGRFGTDYVTRAVIARVALASNTPSQALYPTTTIDSERRPLSGRHRYVIRFARGELPPVRAFWSLTLYDSHLALYANAQRRYAIGDRTPGLRFARDGSLTISIQHARPRGGQAANWLPAPRGPFQLYLRLYEPGAAAAHGSWRPPGVVRLPPLS